MADPVLDLREVRRVYNAGTAAEVPVLQGVDLSLSAGEIVALEAPSGAGKSTLLHIAGLLDRPDGGAVCIEGCDVAGLGDRARTGLRRAAIGFVYQFHHLLPEFTAAENVALPQMAAGIAGRIARAHHRPAALSGGEQQRVAFCRALANRPRLLLADEPTGNLDPATADQVFAVMLDLARDEGLAALVATHNPDLAARMDRRLRLQAGVLVPA
jgi:lipoprotein-releasing system ATP-binding protein